MKRIVLSIFALLVLLCGVAVAEETTIVASGECGASGSNLTWTLDSEGMLTISGEGRMKGYNSGFAPWYSNRASIQTAVIEEGVTSIGNNAFADCSGLSSITIPEGVTSIGIWTFIGCNSLKKVYVTSLEGWLNISFSENCSTPLCYGGELYIADVLVTDLILPKGITQINEHAFEGCNSLRSITIPAGVTSIGRYAFDECSSLRNITIPEGVTSIGSYAFFYCSSLINIGIPDSVTYIGDSAFRNCPLRANILFHGNNVPMLGSNVFPNSPIIYCYEYSDVDFWAMENGYSCVYIDDMDLNRPLSIELPEDMRLAPGESFTVTPTTFPQNATQGIIWESLNPSVVSVENGVLTAHAVGEATITASCDELSDQMNVTVYASVESFELSETELCVVSKQSAQLDICDIEPVGATAFFTWESSDTSVLTVSSGTISALKPGDATVTVTSDNGVVRSCLVHVCYPVTGIELEKSAYQLTVGSDAQITANVTMRTQSCVNQLVTFASSDEAVATVDQTGSIHAVGPGTATITVSAASGITASCAVTVEPCPHIPVTDPAVPATHVTSGLTEGSHCSVCGEVLAAQQSVPVVEVSEIVALPAELKTIEAEAFAGDTFACVVLPDGCEAIGAGAFKDCAQLRFIEIPRSVEYIDGSAFAGCSGDLIIVTVPSSAALCFAQEHEITCVLR